MEIWDSIVEQQRLGVRCILVTILEVRGSVPGLLGAKALIGDDGLIAGTLGGGRVEAMAISTAQELLRTRKAVCEERCWNLQRDVGMTCGGEMRFLFESVGSELTWHIVIFGAGHVAQALVAVLGRLACKVDAIDTRSEWLQRLPAARNIRTHLVGDYVDGVSLITPESFVLSLTKGHSFDGPVLREIFKLHPAVPYVGVIGRACPKTGRFLRR
ncbi:MAG: XdhC family protein [Verrucomicrobia bacterium]|nr:XdhC family protein [Verrucomicrobiota bacterium]